jgi:ankyrin repeat protein
MIACEKGFMEIIEFLINLEECQINCKDSKQRTPIMHALDAPGENLDVISYLIKCGADVNLTSIDGVSPLLKAT